MAVTKPATQITFAAANSFSLGAGLTVKSDSFTPGVADDTLTVQVKADNAGAPAAGDEVEVYLQRTLGDPDAEPDVADEFESDQHSLHLGTLDTFLEDPALLVAEGLGAVFKAARLYFVSNAASAITISATVTARNVP